MTPRLQTSFSPTIHQQSSYGILEQWNIGMMIGRLLMCIFFTIIPIFLLLSHLDFSDF